MTAYDFHPFVEIFPPMGRTALLDLAEDIASNGLSTPIVLLTDTADDGESRTRILDGRHRYLACMETRQPEEYLRFVDFTEVAGPDADPLRWVRSQNLSRRHLTRSQRIDAAARWTELFEHRATESRQAAAARTNAQRWGTTPSTNTDTGTDTDTAVGADTQQSLLPAEPTGRTRDLAAREFGVSPSAVQTTRRIRKEGVEDLANLHRDGWVSTHTAARIAELPAADQANIVTAIQAAETDVDARRIAREQIKERHPPPPPAAAPLPAPAPAPSPATTTPPPTAATTPFYALPDRGEVLVSRNALDVLLAVAAGELNHPHRAGAINAVRLLLQHTDWSRD